MSYYQMQKECVYNSLADAVIRGPPYNTYSIKSVMRGEYVNEETEIVQAIRNHDWMRAKTLASEYICSQFESKASADLSKFNRVIGHTAPPCKYPSPGQIYDQVMDCIVSATDPSISRIGYNTEFAHKVCAAISKSRPWYIYFKSMIVFKVYKLWYASVTAGHPNPPVVQVHCAMKPDMPSHWEHWPTSSTPAFNPNDILSSSESDSDGPQIMEVPSYTLAYEEDWGWYNASDPSAVRIYYQSKAKAKRAFSNTL